MTLQEVATYLESKGLGTIGTDLFRAWTPDSPNTCLTVTEYGGRLGPDIWKFGQDGVAREYVRVQLKVRGEPEDYDTPRLHAQDAYRTLCLSGPSTLSGTDYYSVTPLQPPFPLERDGRLRYVFACNFELFKQVTTFLTAEVPTGAAVLAGIAPSVVKA